MCACDWVCVCVCTCVWECVSVYNEVRCVRVHVHVMCVHTCSSMVPVAFFSRATACAWVMASADVPQMLTIRSPVCVWFEGGEQR